MRVNPRTNELQTDIERAHIAIDSIISLVDKLEPSLTGDERSRLRNLITEPDNSNPKESGSKPVRSIHPDEINGFIAELSLTFTITCQ